MAPGRYAKATDGLLRSTVLDAVADLVIEQDWDRLSMAKIANGAGVSRQTLYNEFGDRDGLLEAYVIREAGRFLDGVETTIVANRDDLPTALLAGFRRSLETADDHPVVRAVVTGQASIHVFDPLVSASSRPVIDLAAGRLSAIVETCWPALDPDDVAALADVFVRLSISYLTQGQPDIDRCMEGLERVLRPAIEAVGAVSDATAGGT